MSRSYKKNPGHADRNPAAKCFANRKVRRTPDIPNGRAYRKLYPRWNIKDYASLWFDSRTWYSWERHEYETLPPIRYRRPWKAGYKNLISWEQEEWWKYTSK